MGLIAGGCLLFVLLVLDALKDPRTFGVIILAMPLWLIYTYWWFILIAVLGIAGCLFLRGVIVAIPERAKEMEPDSPRMSQRLDDLRRERLNGGRPAVQIRSTCVSD